MFFINITDRRVIEVLKYPKKEIYYKYTNNIIYRLNYYIIII